MGLRSRATNNQLVRKESFIKCACRHGADVAIREGSPYRRCWIHRVHDGQGVGVGGTPSGDLGLIGVRATGIHQGPHFLRRRRRRPPSTAKDPSRNTRILSAPLTWPHASSYPSRLRNPLNTTATTCASPWISLTNPCDSATRGLCVLLHCVRLRHGEGLRDRRGLPARPVLAVRPANGTIAHPVHMPAYRSLPLHCRNRRTVPTDRRIFFTVWCRASVSRSAKASIARLFPYEASASRRARSTDMSVRPVVLA
jgi:hypothetical protein